MLRNGLAAGVVKEALFGGVDEVPFSKWQFETKFNRPYRDYKMIEGSCWLLIKADNGGALGEIAAIESFDNLNQTAQWLSHQRFKRPLILSFGMLIDPGQKASLSQAVLHEGEFNYISEYGYFDSVTACGISGVRYRKHEASTMAPMASA